MTVIVRIAGEPARNYFRGPDAVPDLPAAEARHALLRGLSPLRSSSSENANMTIELDNRGGVASRLLASLPPIGAAVSVQSDGAEVFAGAVQRLTLSADGAGVEVEA